MHPELGGNAHASTLGKASVSNDEVMTPKSNPRGNPTTFFMATEADIENREKGNTVESSVTDSRYGVRSIDESTSMTEHMGEKEEQDTSSPRGKNRRRSTIKPQDIVTRDVSTEGSGRHSSISSTGSSPPRNHVTRSGNQLDSLSQPLTPLSFASPFLASEAPSSPKSLDGRSLRISDDEDLGDTGSQAIASDNEDEEQDLQGTQSMEAVQLIMPSIMMPTRRPFTERGKNIGKVKVLLAGPSGVGKTSLIKSIVQVCDDIVHVDPVSSRSNQRRTPKSRSRVSHANPTKRVTEVHASTKAYPLWWSDIEENDGSKRRKSTGENMLERNVCFVDTPGYDNSTSVLEGMKTTLDYIEAQMSKSTMAGELKESELLSMLCGDGGLQVDLVLYLIAHDLKPADIEYLRQLSHLTPTIPILAKSDTVLQSSLAELKPAIVEQLRIANITPFSLLSSSLESVPYAVCSSPSNELESMDASLLMQPDFLPPLTPSDLPQLLNDLFEPTNLSILKHTSSRKLLRWRSNPRASPLPAPLTAAIGPSPSLVASTSSPTTLPSLSLTTRPQTFSPLTHPRLAAHTEREERLANIRLASWASQLQRSLASERAKYEELARQDRANWLKIELEKCRDVDVGALSKANVNSLIPVHNSDSRSSRSSSEGNSVRENGTRRIGPGSIMQRQCGWEGMDIVDPLGILGMGEKMQRAGWTTVRILGGCSVVGGLAVLIVRLSGYGQSDWGLTIVREWWDGVWATWNGE